MTEAEEIAANMPLPPSTVSFNGCHQIVRDAMPGYEERMIVNVANALYQRTRWFKPFSDQAEANTVKPAGWGDFA